MFSFNSNIIAVSDQYVSFTHVVLHNGLNYQLRHMQINKTVNNEKNRRSEVFLEVEHKHDNPVASLDYACVNKSMIYVTKWWVQTPKALKIQQFEHSQYPRIASDSSSCIQPWWYLDTHNKNFACLDSFAKVFVSGKPIIPGAY